MELTVSTVTHETTTLREAPAAIFVITPEMIRRSGARTLPELFRMVPGMDVARIDGNTWAVSARGFNSSFSNKMLVQIDGRTLYTPIYSGVYWDTVDFPFEDIERIEIIRGPGATVWGANAVNGIINILTKSSEKTQGGLLVGGTGSVERLFGTARYGGTLGKQGHYRGWAKAFNRNGGSINTAGGSPHDALWNARGGFRTDWRLSDRDDLQVQGSYFHSDADLRHSLPLPVAPFVMPTVTDEESNGGNLLAHWRRELGEKSRLSLKGYWDHVQRNFSDNSGALGWDTLDLDFYHQFPLGRRHQFTYGVGGRAQMVKVGQSGFDGGFFLQGSSRNLYVASGFVQDEITLVDKKLIFTTGSKFEHNSFTGFEVQPSARLAFIPSPKHSLWVSVARAVRTPSLLEDDLNVTLTALSTAPLVYATLVGNPGFDSEKLWAYEAGYRFQPVRRFSLDMAFYHNRYSDLGILVPGALTPATTPPGATLSPFFIDNRMTAQTYGACIRTTYEALPRWHLALSYALHHDQLNPDPTLAAFFQTIAKAGEGQTPAHQVYLQSQLDLPLNFEFDVAGRFVSKLHGFNPSGTAGVPDTVKAYVEMDARVAWQATPRLEFSLVGQNLLHHHHGEFGRIQTKRSVYGKVTWEF